MAHALQKDRKSTWDIVLLEKVGNGWYVFELISPIFERKGKNETQNQDPVFSGYICIVNVHRSYGNAIHFQWLC